MKIVESEDLKFPLKKEEGRNELEEYIKKTGIWEQVSDISQSKLSEIVEDDTFDKKIKDQLLKFGERIKKTSVRLAKKKVDDE